MKTIEVEIKNVYGNQTIYPISEDAKIFAKMLGQKALTQTDIKYIKELGYEVKVVQAINSL